MALLGPLGGILTMDVIPLYRVSLAKLGLKLSAFDGDHGVLAWQALQVVP
jgi:hypothetical protein